MTTQDYDKAILALACWREADGKGLEKMLCIAHTIANLSKLKGLSIGAAILEHCATHNICTAYSKFPDVRDPVFSRFLQIIENIFSPQAEDLTNGALYYIDMAKPVPPNMRFLLDSPEGHPMCSMAGTLHFFK